MITPYRDVSQLVMQCEKDQDYAFRISDPGADITIVAVHGGWIEPPTGELASAIAGQEYNLYVLRGLRPDAREQMRVPIGRFSEMRLNALLRRSHAALHIDGVPGEEAIVHLGGRNRRLKAVLEEHLQTAGLIVAAPYGPGAAHDPRRFYNLPDAGGVQMELSLALRRQMVDGLLDPEVNPQNTRQTPLFVMLTRVVRDALQLYLAQARSDLELTMERFERTTRQFPDWLRRGGHEARPDAVDESGHRGRR
ncbi:MAG: poly-gamma-glutamate hydrolase family protein [Chloroflexi bacterium]|nr:poly-gamma-glutamate hydrolase family protein [Chloroflexota bacterium]